MKEPAATTSVNQKESLLRVEATWGGLSGGVVLISKRSPRGISKATAGFSMIELMFAIMICTIVLLGLLGVLGSVLRNQAEGRTYETVSIAANTIFGQAGQALSENFQRPLVPDVFPEGRQPVPNLEGISFEVSEVALKDDLRQVDVVIYWTDEKGVEHKKPMSTKFLKE